MCFFSGGRYPVLSDAFRKAEELLFDLGKSAVLCLWRRNICFTDAGLRLFELSDGQMDRTQ